MLRLEANVEHIRSDVAEVKADVRRLDSKLDALKDSFNTFAAATNDRLAALELRVEKGFAALDARIDKSAAVLGLKFEEGLGALRTARMLDRIWWLLITGALLGVMARGFKWI